MTRIIEDELVDVVTGTLVGVIDVDDGPTDEQRAVGHAMARGAECTGDVTGADHLALAGRHLAGVRADFGVPPHQR